MLEIPLFYSEKGSKFKKNPLEKGVVFNSQNNIGTDTTGVGGMGGGVTAMTMKSCAEQGLGTGSMELWLNENGSELYGTGARSYNAW